MIMSDLLIFISNFVFFCFLIVLCIFQNKILHSRLEAFHIQLAEKDRVSSGLSSGNTSVDTPGDAGLQNVINYLRRSKEIVSFLGGAHSLFHMHKHTHNTCMCACIQS